jgi:23S rRNA pseudouridine955/2504/2580 synthase
MTRTPKAPPKSPYKKSTAKGSPSRGRTASATSAPSRVKAPSEEAKSSTPKKALVTKKATKAAFLQKTRELLREPSKPIAPLDSPKPLQRSQAELDKIKEINALSTTVQTLTVTDDEAGMRVDRFLEARFKGLSFSHIQRIVRKGQLRVNGKRVETKDRLVAQDLIRVPPLNLDEPRPLSENAQKLSQDATFLKSITLYEDADVMILNKPMGLAVQGGSGTYKHVDGMLTALTDKDGQKPRLVHRLDKDTAGCLVIAKTRFAAMTMAKSFRSRSARKIYWAVIAGMPRVRQGRISTYLAKEESAEGDSKMTVAKHGDEGASHALTYYAVIDQMAQKLAWVSFKPVTGRTHQLRAHAAHIGHPIVGDPKYFDIENWELPGGIQNKLHLLARRIVIPHPRTGQPLDITAPLPPHMLQTFNLLGFDTSQYDPIVEAPES